MTSQIKRKKNLGRTLAVLAIIGSFVGLTSLPAFAYEDSWTLEVNVSDTTCTDPIEDPSWSPDVNVTYLYSNDVDLNPSAYNPPGLLNFSVGLGLTPGYDPCTTWNVDVSGDVEASVTELDGELSMSALDCSSSTICDAFTLYTGGNEILGTIDASAVTTTGLKTGVLTVVWTPAD